MNLEAIKPESLYTDDERRLRVTISLLEDRIANNDQIIQVLANKNTELTDELATVRKSTLYNKSIYMQNNYKWISAIVGTVLTVIGSIATVVYKFVL
jgi:hypothetical protein